MIGCNGDDSHWFHSACLGTTDQELQRIEVYFCKECRGVSGNVGLAAGCLLAGGRQERARHVAKSVFSFLILFPVPPLYPLDADRRSRPLSLRDI